jgi:hypothetical protein
MSIPIVEALGIILSALYKFTELNGPKLTEITKLTPTELNDAVTILESNGYVSLFNYMGTTPYEFGEVQITPAGKFEYERVIKEMENNGNNKNTPTQVNRNIIPVGSPYGFQDEDWETLSSRKGHTDILNVVLGYQFNSLHYDNEKLRKNINDDFIEAVNNYNGLPNAIPITLNFRPLAAGYGEHLFNEIARDIISSDIAIFDTSDLNPNVMVEMGVALTWGVRVLPIKKEGCPKPPSDISGQTWADYIDSGNKFVDNEHMDKLNRMVERAARKKSRP